MLGQVVLTVGEYESLRLVDHEGLDHERAAQKMKVSRATCARVVESAHKKVAEALTQGKAIQIEGGNFTLEKTRYRCQDCGFIWEAELNTEDPDPEKPVKQTCRKCKSSNVLDLSQKIGWMPPGMGRWGKGRWKGAW